jgi:phage-related protein
MQHHHWSGKHCPRNIREGRPFGWDVFLDKVTAAKANETNILEILGAKETEAIITIENNTSSVITETGIVGFIVKNLAVGEKIIIDGIKKTVTSNGENVFNRVEFFNFPRFSPDINDVSVVGCANITIAYRERW